MSLPSVRAMAELAALFFIGWLLIHNANLKTRVANLKTDVQAAQLRVQASDVSNRSCQVALAASGKATEKLAQATVSAYAQTDRALQAASTRDQVVRPEVTRLLSVRPAAGQDCQTATGLARAAWLEGQ